MSTICVHKQEIPTKNKEVRPRWGKRLLKGVRTAGLVVAVGFGALAVSGCGKTRVQPVIPRAPHNIYCDPQLGTFFVRPDGVDIVLSSPHECGASLCIPIVPFAAWAVYRDPESRP